MIFSSPMFARGYAPLQAFASPASLSKSVSGADRATTAAATASYSGGSGGVTYAWSCTNGVAANSPSSATTTFSRSLDNGESATSVATVTITDTATGQSATATVSLSFSSSYVAPALAWSLSPANQQVFGDGVPSIHVSGSWTVIPSGGSGSYSISSSFIPSSTPVSLSVGGATLSATFDVAFGTSTGGIWVIDITDNATGQTLHLERGMTFTNPSGS